MSEHDERAQALSNQMDFARHNFENLQALIRFADTKAGALITIVILLGAGSFPIVREAVRSVQTASLGFAVWFGLSYLVFFVVLIISLRYLHATIRPRGAKHGAFQKGKDLFWQEHIVAYGSKDEYFAALANADSTLLLRNLSDQTFELAHISSEKMKAVGQLERACWVAFIAWLANVTCVIMMFRFGPAS
ncbi:MAG TPA: hypothetical protein VN176_19780 [Verrucomicrobiae bacterium]|jgi:hypothetical protein|nr:hypothetical protein [Verrucomicrobiae bacterium]